jgi:metal-sulfur cluster biosynthetic enzyme
MGELMTTQAEDALRKKFPAVKSVKVDIVWEPPWNARMMSADAKKQLGTGK